MGIQDLKANASLKYNGMQGTIERYFVSGPKAGRYNVVLDSIKDTIAVKPKNLVPTPRFPLTGEFQIKGWYDYNPHNYTIRKNGSLTYTKTLGSAYQLGFASLDLQHTKSITRVDSKLVNEEFQVFGSNKLPGLRIITNYNGKIKEAKILCNGSKFFQHLLATYDYLGKQNWVNELQRIVEETKLTKVKTNKLTPIMTVKSAQGVDDNPDGMPGRSLSVSPGAAGSVGSGRRRMAQRQFSSRRDSPVMVRLPKEIIEGNRKHNSSK